MARQRGWEALKAIGWSGRSAARAIPRRPRPRTKPPLKRLAAVVAEEAAQHPDKAVQVWAADEHRIGLKPITRRVWAPKGERPIARGHHRYEWLRRR